jgi:hypothetical protein
VEEKTAYDILKPYIGKHSPEKENQIKILCETNPKLKLLAKRYLETQSTSTLATLYTNLGKIISELLTVEGKTVTCLSCYNQRSLDNFTHYKDLCDFCLRGSVVDNYVYGV